MAEVNLHAVYKLCSPCTLCSDRVLLPIISSVLEKQTLYVIFVGVYMGMMHLYISHQLMTGDTLPFVRIAPRNAFLQSLLHMQSVVNNYTLHWCVFSKQFSRPRGAAAVTVF